MNPVSQGSTHTSNLNMESVNLPKPINDTGNTDTSKEPMSAGNMRNVQGLYNDVWQIIFDRQSNV